MTAVAAPRRRGPLGREGERIAAELRQLEGRVTPAKIGVIAALSSPGVLPEHLTARELRSATALMGIRLDEATVYRTVARLEELELIHSVAFERATRYGLQLPAHHHAICEQCGVLRSIPAADLDALVTTACSLADFADGRQQALTLRGTCNRCAGTISGSPPADAGWPPA